MNWRAAWQEIEKNLPEGKIEFVDVGAAKKSGWKQSKEGQFRPDGKFFKNLWAEIVLSRKPSSEQSGPEEIQRYVQPLMIQTPNERGVIGTIFVNRVVKRSGEYLLVLQRRPGSLMGVFAEFPRRSVSNPTQPTISPIQKRLGYYYADNARIVGKIEVIVQEWDEIFEYVDPVLKVKNGLWVTKEELKEMFKEGKLQDGHTLVALGMLGL